MLTMTAVTPDCRDQLWGMLQGYLREMSAFYPGGPDEAGDCPYPWFGSYFTDPERAALFLEAERQRVGFALVNRFSCIGGSPDHAMAEFCVLPEYRGKGLGLGFATAVFRRYPGRWEVKYHLGNRAAVSLWTRAAGPYHPRVTALGEEQVLSFTVNEEV